MPDFAYPCLVESVSVEMPSEQSPGAVPNFVFTLRDMDVSQPDPPPVPSVLPPGSICETCWDQPATQVLPAPWGGEMGVCVWCAKGVGDEADSLVALLGSPDVMTIEQTRAYAQELLTDAMQRNSPPNISFVAHGVSFEQQYLDDIAVSEQAALQPGVQYEYSSGVGGWQRNIADCPSGVRYIRAVCTPVNYSPEWTMTVELT